METDCLHPARRCSQGRQLFQDIYQVSAADTDLAVADLDSSERSTGRRCSFPTCKSTDRLEIDRVDQSE